jgi:H+/Cl- antiporter ClcA
MIRVKKKEFIFYIIGGIVGLAAGYLYWRTVGCSGDRCAIWSSNWKSALAGTILGSLGGGSLYDILNYFSSAKEGGSTRNTFD